VLLCRRWCCNNATFFYHLEYNLKILAMKKLIFILIITFYTLIIFGQCQADFYPCPNTIDPILDTVYFLDNSTNAVTWLWDFGDSTTSTLQNPIHYYSSTGLYYVCLIITDGISCTDTICDSVWVSSCTADYTYVPTLQANTIKFLGMPYLYHQTNWHWDFGDGDTSNIRLPIHTYSTAGTYDVSVTVNDSTQNCDYTVNKTINVFPPQNVKISVCDGYWSDHYIWNTNSVPTQYDSVLIYHNVILDIDYTSISPGLIYIEENSSLCGHQILSSQLIAYGKLDVDYYYMTGIFSFSDTIPLNGQYGLSIGNCMIGKWPTEMPFTCNDNFPPCIVQIKENSSIIEAFVFPNPTTGKITIQAEGIESIEIMSIRGELVISKKTKGKNQKYLLDLSKESKGIYFIKVTTSNDVAVEKVILN